MPDESHRGGLYREGYDVLDKLAEDGTLFRVGWATLLRHLLADYHEGRVFEATAPELRSAAAFAIDEDVSSLPEDVDDLARHVLRECVHIGKLPMEVFVDLHQKADEDLRAIRNNIEECRRRLAELTKRRDQGAGADGDSYEIQYLQHKEKQNLEAREDIIAFLESGIYDEVIRQAQRPVFRFLDAIFVFRTPYHYRWAPHVYSPDSLSEVQNKFNHEAITDLREWERLYDTDKETFHKKVSKYIQEKRVVARMRDLLDQHHRLAARKPVLEPALAAYESGQHALFCNVAPIQIEGMFEDYAIDIGVPPSGLRSATLVRKLEEIRAKVVVFVDFEYFRFRFPVRRNQVAHGRFETDNAERLANLLLLDVFDLFRRLQDDEIPLNRLVALLREADSSKPADLFSYAQLRLMDVPDFYGDAGSARSGFDAALSERVFWDWLAEQVQLEEPELNAKIRSTVIALKRDRLDGGHAADLLRSMASSGAAQ